MLSMEYLQNIYGISLEYLWNIYGISIRYLCNVSGNLNKSCHVEQLACAHSSLRGLMYHQGVTASNNLCFCCSPLLTTNQLKLKHPRRYTLVNTCKPSFSPTMHIKIENPSFQACLAAFYLVLLTSTYKLLINYLCLLNFKQILQMPRKLT